jgi:GNAT superfamily N-acetyltransferase
MAMDREPQPAFEIRPATERDVPIILEFIRELAEYERLLATVTATEDELRASLFGPLPAAEVVIGYAGYEPAGFALYFRSFSTFLGKPGLYLEDLFVRPEWRGLGLGRRLLRHLARIAVDRGYGRMEWSVLDWNEPAIAVYRKVGATPMTEWTVQRLTGDALRALASEA